MGLVGLRRGIDEARIERQTPHYTLFACVIEPLQRRRTQELPPLRVAQRPIREGLKRVAEDRMPTCMAILDIENRVVARLFDDPGQVEIEDRVVLAVEHHE